MVEAGTKSQHGLSLGQWTLIARKLGAFSGKPVADVGCGDGQWVTSANARGATLLGMEEKLAASGPSHEKITVGSPSAAVPWESHSLDAILLRGTSLMQSPRYSPELMIGLANLGSSLKANGRLVIPLLSSNPQEIDAELTRWKSQLSIFPGTFRTRQLSTGMMGYLTLAFLFGKTAQVNVIEFHVSRKVVSRLEWHKLARTAVMSHMNNPAVAS